MKIKIKTICMVLLLCQSTLTVGQSYEMAFEHRTKTESFGSDDQGTLFTGNTDYIQTAIDKLTKLNGNVSIGKSSPAQSSEYRYMSVEGQFATFSRLSETFNPVAVQMNVFADINSPSIGTITLDQSNLDSGFNYDTYDFHNGQVSGVKRDDFVFFKLYPLANAEHIAFQPKLDINIELNPNRKIAVKYLSVKFYYCHPTCGDCDQATRSCNNCANLAIHTGVDKCTCDRTVNQYSRLVGGSYWCQNYVMESIGGWCSQFTQDKFSDYCNTCTDPKQRPNNYNYVLYNFDFLPSCSCPSTWGYPRISNQAPCLTRLEIICNANSGLANIDMSQDAFIANLSTNVNLLVRASIDNVFGDDFFKVEPQISNMPGFYPSPIAIKLRIKNSTQSWEILNTYINDSNWGWDYSDVNMGLVAGINIRKSDLVNNKLDCVAGQNGLTWTCNIWMDVYNPCSGTMYSQTQTAVMFNGEQITISQGLEVAFEHNPESQSAQHIPFTGDVTAVETPKLTKLNGNVTIGQSSPVQSPDHGYMVVEGQFTIFTSNFESTNSAAAQINVFADINSPSLGSITLDPSTVDSALLYDTYDLHSGPVTGVKRWDFPFFKLYPLVNTQQTRFQPKLDITIGLNPNRVITVRYLKVSFYKCHPTCSECDKTTRACKTCPANATTTLGNEKCTCTQLNNIYSRLMNQDYSCSSSADFNASCPQLTQSKLRDYCTTCSDPRMRPNWWNGVGFDISPACLCPPRFVNKIINNQSKCISKVESICLDNPGFKNPDISQIKAFTDNLSANVILSISTSKDNIFGEKYFTVEPIISNLPSFNSVPLSIKISIKGTSQNIEIFNIYTNDGTFGWDYSDVSTNGSGAGINIRKSDLVNNKLDCVASQSGALTWKCNIIVDILNPCSGIVYSETVTVITLPDNGLVQTNFTIDNTTASINTLKCIVNNECFYNENYSADLFACNNGQCTDQRLTQYAPGDYIYLKPTINYQGTPGTFSIGIEYAVFIVKDQYGAEVTIFNALTDLTTSNNNTVFGFRIPAATKLINSYGLVSTGSLYLTFIIRINNPLRYLVSTSDSLASTIPVNLRRLEEKKYSVTATNPIIIKLDPKYFDPNYVDSNELTGSTQGSTGVTEGITANTEGSTGGKDPTNVDILKIALPLAGALVIAIIVIIVIVLKRRKQGEMPVPNRSPVAYNYQEKPIPNSPRTCNNEEKPVETKEVKIQFGN
jgi:hypothetical protein